MTWEKPLILWYYRGREQVVDWSWSQGLKGRINKGCRCSSRWVGSKGKGHGSWSSRQAQVEYDNHLIMALLPSGGQLDPCKTG